MEQAAKGMRRYANAGWRLPLLGSDSSICTALRFRDPDRSAGPDVLRCQLPGPWLSLDDDDLDMTVKEAAWKTGWNVLPPHSLVMCCWGVEMDS